MGNTVERFSRTIEIKLKPTYYNLPITSRPIDSFHQPRVRDLGITTGALPLSGGGDRQNTSGSDSLYEPHFW